MSSLWAALQGQEKPSTNIANDDAVVVDDPVRGAPIRAPAHIAFKPFAQEMPSDDFTDLLALDPPPSAGGSPGRPRLYPNNANRQKAYRLRQKFGDLV